ncbi:MAG: thiamine pyrophosphate-binding protein [Deltaproteobacteria bacterium]|nr:MAG: thiamine pyrophosphate-binding protein [Deltaproteobacteria bacterium]
MIAKKLAKLSPLAKPTVLGGEILSWMLAAEGVEHAFGIIDGTYFGLVSTLGGHGVDLVTPRHEATALHMAGAYARISGRLGVAIASNGPGVANALGGVAVEHAEGNRVLLITSCRRVGLGYPDRGGAYQYFPHVDVMRPMSKWAEVVPSIDRLAEMTRAALRACFTGRPGVVHLDVPEDIINGEFEPRAEWYREPDQYRSLHLPAPRDEQVDAAAAMLRESTLPVLHAGSGIVHAGAERELQRLATLLQAPVTTSWGARCVLDERQPEAVSMVFVEATNTARREADCALVLGSRLGETDWWGKAPYWGDPGAQRLIQVDIDPDILGANRSTDLAILGDVRAFLQALCDRLEADPIPREKAEARRAQLDKLATMRTKRRAELDRKLEDRATPMHPAHVATTCDKVLDDDAILVIDGGNTAIWANFYHRVRTPHSLLGTPKMGMLGAGVGQALGAKAAFPHRQVVCVLGDGAMGFHQQEIETAVRAGLPVIYVVLCDRQWGMVKINQSFMLKPVKTLLFKSLRPDETVNTDLCETRFDQLARSMGAHGERVSSPDDLEPALRRCIQIGRPAVIHVDVDPTKHMWAPDLKTFKDMHAEPAGTPSEPKKPAPPKARKSSRKRSS